jgi:hypothetical protein
MSGHLEAPARRFGLALPPDEYQPRVKEGPADGGPTPTSSAYSWPLRHLIGFHTQILVRSDPVLRQERVRLSQQLKVHHCTCGPSSSPYKRR